MVEVRLVVHEAGHAPGTVRPAQTRAVAHSRQGFHADLTNSADRSHSRMETIGNRGAFHRKLVIVQGVGAGNTRIPGAELAGVEIIARRPADPRHLAPARVEGAAVIDLDGLAG